MKFMITWQFKPDKLHEGLDFFSRIPAEHLAADHGPEIRLIGRWHDLVRGRGVLICESDHPVAVSTWCLNWNTLIDLDLAIVHDDAETQAIGQARMPAG
ncbi:MAG: DUF3303 domain-containing protein [Cyanobium sp.]